MFDNFSIFLQKCKKVDRTSAEKILSKLAGLKETLELNKNGPLPFGKLLLSIDKHNHGAKHICVECFYQKVIQSNPGRPFDQNIDYFFLDFLKEEAESFKCVFEGCKETTTLKTITDSFIKA